MIKKEHRIYLVPSQTYGYALLTSHDEDAPADTKASQGIWIRVKAAYVRWTESALAQERALKKARRAPVVDVCYPSGLPRDEAAQIFRRRVEQEMRHHIIWLLIDFPLLIPAALAMAIPGPNVFFLFWVIRIMGHYHAYDGGKQILNRAELRYHASEDLGEWHRVLRDKITERFSHVIPRLEKLIGIRNLRALLVKRRRDAPTDG